MGVLKPFNSCSPQKINGKQTRRYCTSFCNSPVLWFIISLGGELVFQSLLMSVPGSHEASVPIIQIAFTIKAKFKEFL